MWKWANIFAARRTITIAGCAGCAGCRRSCRSKTDGLSFPDSLTGSVLGAVFEVSNTLGAGFLEKVYERALLLELRLRGIRAVGQVNQVSALPNNGCAPVPPTPFAWRPVVSCETPKSPPARLTHSLCCIGCAAPARGARRSDRGSRVWSLRRSLRQS